MLAGRGPGAAAIAAECTGSGALVAAGGGAETTGAVATDALGAAATGASFDRLSVMPPATATPANTSPPITSGRTIDDFGGRGVDSISYEFEVTGCGACAKSAWRFGPEFSWPGEGVVGGVKPNVGANPGDGFAATAGRPSVPPRGVGMVGGAAGLGAVGGMTASDVMVRAIGSAKLDVWFDVCVGGTGCVGAGPSVGGANTSSVTGDIMSPPMLASEGSFASFARTR